MKIKKIGAMILSGVLAAGLLSGCGGPSKDSSEKENTTGTETSSGSDESKKSGSGEAEYNWTCGVNLPTDHPYYTGCVKFGE